MSETTTRVYELGYLLVPTTPEQEVQAAIEVLTKTLTDQSGVILSQGNPEYIDLAYPMQQRVASKLTTWDQAYFGWIKFELDPANSDAVKKVLDLNQSLIRYLITKTSAENTVVFRKPKNEAKRGQGILEDTDGLIDEAALEAETVALEESGVFDEGTPAVHETLPDLSADIAETTETESE